MQATLIFCISLPLHLNVCPFLGFLCLFDSHCDGLRTLIPLSIDVVFLLLFQLRKLAHPFLLLHDFVQSLKLELLLAVLIWTGCQALLSHILHSLVERLCFALTVLIGVVLGTLLTNLQFDLHSVELRDDLLIIEHPILLLASHGCPLSRLEVFLALPGLAVLKLLLLESALLNLSNVLLVAPQRLKLQTTLLILDFFSGLLALLAEKVRLVDSFLHGVAKLLLSHLLLLMTLLQLVLKSVKVFAHLPIDVYLRALKFFI